MLFTRTTIISALVFSAHLLFSAHLHAAVAETRNQVSGFYSEKGKLQDANALKSEGKGFVHLFGKRERPYGSDGLVRILTALASNLANQFPDGERLQIGDMANRTGGEARGHASHQNGLDADIAYFRIDHREQVDDEGKIGFDENFVQNGKVTENFDVVRNWAIVKTLQKTGRLERIFVNENIKARLCEHARETHELETEFETLRKLRHFPNHENHLHVRLTCPSTSPKCIAQDPIPGPGNGCFVTTPLPNSEWSQGDF